MIYNDVWIFEIDMSLLIKEGKDIFILGKGPTQELNHTLAAETT